MMVRLIEIKPWEFAEMIERTSSGGLPLVGAPLFHCGEEVWPKPSADWRVERRNGNMVAEEVER